MRRWWNPVGPSFHPGERTPSAGGGVRSPGGKEAAGKVHTQAEAQGEKLVPFIIPE